MASVLYEAAKKAEMGSWQDGTFNWEVFSYLGSLRVNYHHVWKFQMIALNSKTGKVRSGIEKQSYDESVSKRTD
ncbi:hypothetical protein [Pseudoalteromonas luteoviolacea]|uniref:hypothetical protein n=1 Tax=Pseudoalteromonas luteoviolacea TaxID=43657 RepID=UPI0012DA6953|nr:hypothetical protein [Pseudoalteromonas luteoviolacea]